MKPEEMAFLAVIVALPIVSKIVNEELYRRRQDEHFRISRIASSMDDTERFREVHVPIEIQLLGTRRSFKPLDGGDYRVLVDDNGKWSVFPRRRLSDEQKAAIVKLMATVKE